MRFPVQTASVFAVSLLAAIGLALVHDSGSSAAVRFETRRTEVPVLLAAIDRFRTQHGLPLLRASAPLEHAALAHDLEMIRYGFFGHSSPGGAAFWQRVEHWYPERGRRWTVGENLLSASPDVSVAATLSHWVASPEHRAVLLDPSWVSVGIAIVHVQHAAGVYGGAPTTVVTADFGRPG